MRIQTQIAFRQFVTEFEEQPGYKRPRAFGIGFVTVDSNGAYLDALYPMPNHRENYGTAAVFAKVLNYTGDHQAMGVLNLDIVREMLEYFEWTEGDGKHHGNVDALRRAAKLLRNTAFRNSINTRMRVVACAIPEEESDKGPSSVPDAYLRLHLLSHRKVRPHGINLDNLFAVLPNNVWTNEGPISEADLHERRMDALTMGRPFLVHARDKIPQMLDYVVPSGVRIADASRVRLGAYLGEGVTVMHEGFCNYNAGAEGPNMIEGRISQGVWVGSGTDIGGGASIMGTLSGGGKEVITIGRNCLIGANGGTGISLGDNCRIEAGLYITAGMRVLRPDGAVRKASSLSGDSGMTFIRDSETGQVLMRPTSAPVELNTSVHKN